MRGAQADQINAAIDDEVNHLKALNTKALTFLPAYSERDANLDGKVVHVTTWHEVLPSGEHQILLMVVREIWGGMFSYDWRGGFALSSNGGMRALTDEELGD